MQTDGVKGDMLITVSCFLPARDAEEVEEQRKRQVQDLVDMGYAPTCSRHEGRVMVYQGAEIWKEFEE